MTDPSRHLRLAATFAPPAGIDRATDAQPGDAARG